MLLSLKIWLLPVFSPEPFRFAGLIITKHHMCRSYYLLSTMFFHAYICYQIFLQGNYGFVRHYSGGQKNNVMIIGAGDATSMLIKEIVTSDKIDMNVRCVIDDDPHKKNSYIHGVKVVGTGIRLFIMQVNMRYMK